MTRYIAIPRSGVITYSPDGEPSITAETVHEDDGGPQKTGLFDAHGTPLYRCPERVPMGFHVRPSAPAKAARKPRNRGRA